ncbi:hypothetical protein [Silanimonas sp.]|uniref:fibronectin type III domain-containing protein n=1 Tax=Silanimonas sp. TaxID=1929290 RepID=UPI0022C4F6F0|nr:hypothetical protein [Silanimonas sp.]MCZ8114575.1 hypothetical protein [Silanimonas sp.]
MSDVVAISTGHYHACALTRSGNVSCWGSNEGGKLADGTDVDRPLPTTALATAQAITFLNPGDQFFGGMVTLSAVSDSALTIRFRTLTPDVCLVNQAGVVTTVAIGTCAIAADQRGNGAFLPAPQVIRSFAVRPVPPGAPVIAAVTTGDGQVSVAFVPPAENGGAPILGYTITSVPGGIVATGTSSPIVVSGLTNGVAYRFNAIATNIAGNSQASSLSDAVTPIAPQTITFANPGTQTFGASLSLSAAATSGLAVSFSSATTGVCSITSSGSLTFVAAGTCTINADQAGSAAFMAAPRVSQSFVVNAVVPGAPTIGTATAGDSRAEVTFAAPTSNGGAAITSYTVTSNPGAFAASGSGSPITVSGLSNGSVYTFTVRATNIEGAGVPSAASNAVTPKASQTITFANPGTQVFGTTPALLASASSGLVVAFSSGTTAVCRITSQGVLAFVSSGTCIIHADQPGDATFSAASRVSQSFAVSAVVPGTPTIGAAAAGDSQATVTFGTPTSNGGSTITSYTVTSNPGGFMGTGIGSPITVPGLTNGTAYTFTVQATNAVGTGLASAASNRITPQAPLPVLRPDRVTVRDNGGEARIDVLANDGIAPTLLGVGTLSIIDAPLRGSASVLALGPAGLSGDVIVYTPTGAGSGTDTLRYRACFGGASPCVDSTVSIEIRPVDAAGIAFSVDRDRGRRDVELSGLRALPNARFDAHGLVAPAVVSSSLTADSTPETPFDAGGAETTLRTFAAGPSARAWRVFVDARSLSGGDVDVYLGLDADNNGQADSSEVACAAAMSSVAERCELVVNQTANASTRYWVRLHSRSGAQTASAELFEVPVDRPLAQRQLVATGPGAVSANAEFPMRLVWNDATLAPGQVRGGWLEVKSDANTSLGWVPVRIERSAGAAVSFALQSGVDHALALAGSAANDALYIDVPPGMTRLDVTTTSASNLDLYLARVDAPAASSATPTVPSAPARNLASASATTPSGNETLTVNSPVAGRWYVTPVNVSGGTAEVTVRATLTGAGPQLRSGGFFNPQRSGNGLFLYPAGNQWAGLWYTYLQDGTTTWYYLQGAEPGSNGLWRGIIYRSAWNGSGNFLTPVGQATVTPRSTSAFTFSYTLDGETGSEAYENFGGACPTFAGAPLDVSGHWFDPARAGTGYSVQLFANYEFYTVFGYDAQGVPRYLIAERSGIGTATQSMNLDQNTGACPLCNRTGNPVRNTVGTLTRTIGAGTLQRIELTGTYTAGVPGTWAANDSVTPLGGLQGCAGN